MRIIHFVLDNARPIAIGFIGLFLILVGSELTKPSEDYRQSRSIVKILTADESGGGTGWGATTKRGKKVIVTNDHVCEVQSGGFVTVEQSSGNKLRKKVLTRNAQRDICLVQGTDIPSLTLSDEPAKRFDTVKIFGHPFLDPAQPATGAYIGDALVPFYEMAGNGGKCTEGTEERQVDTFFGAITVCVRIEELGLTTVPTFPGNSGSPVLNARGEVVGIINSGDNRTNHGAFVPLPYLREMLDAE